jgi:PAS domain S-box-containing protein
MSSLRILHVEDNVLDAELVQQRLEEEGVDCVIDRVWNRISFEESLRNGAYELIISDFSLPGFDGFSALQLAKSVAPDVPFIFLSGTIGEERAVESLKNGAVDYVLKDRLQRLSAAILRARSESRAQAELRNNYELLRCQAQLLNEARDAIFVRSVDQIVTYWSNGAERIYGWTAVEIIGRKASEILYKPDAPHREAIWQAVLKDGEWNGELAQVTKAGREICVASRRTLLRDAAGTPVAILNINTDITENKTLEMQVLRSQRLESIGSLASGIAHDLNNVLAPILMATELVRDRVEDEEGRRILDVANASARRGADLVKQVLQFARGNKSERSLINFPTLAKELAKFAKNTFPPAIHIETRIDEGRLQILGDGTQIHQVLLNLCVNARDAMPAGGTLTIDVKSQELAGRIFHGHAKPVSGRFIELTVHDTGTGIPEDTLPRIFEPFFSTKTQEKGTGLGLSTVATIVQNHHGFIEASSTLGKGTTFRVYIPAASKGGDTGTATIEAPPPMGNGEWILLVDDELALLEMTKEMLEAYGYCVLTAKDGSEALIRFGANQGRIRAVITDLLMPGLGGQHLLDTVRDLGTKVVLICVSGSADEEVVRSDKTGAQAFLRKPCSTANLLKTLSRLLAA